MRKWAWWIFVSCTILIGFVCTNRTTAPTRFQLETEWKKMRHFPLNGFKRVYAQDAEGHVYDVLSVAEDKISHEVRIENQATSRSIVRFLISCRSFARWSTLSSGLGRGAFNNF